MARAWRMLPDLAASWYSTYQWQASLLASLVDVAQRGTLAITAHRVSFARSSAGFTTAIDQMIFRQQFGVPIVSLSVLRGFLGDDIKGSDVETPGAGAQPDAPAFRRTARRSALGRWLWSSMLSPPPVLTAASSTSASASA